MPLKRGDQTAFQSLYTSFSAKVYSIVLSYVKNEADAQDVTQEVFVKIYRHIHKFRAESSLSTWVYRITVNTCLNHLKKKKNLFVAFTKAVQEPINFVHPGVVLENQENAKALYQALEVLPDSQKTAFILSYIEELPRQEVADIMNTSLKSVEALLQRAKAKLRKKLEKMYPYRRK